MKIAIVGSRNFKPLIDVVGYVNDLNLDDIIVSGGAKGVDLTAQQAAEARGMKTIIFHPNWNRYGISAGFKRNQQIVDECDSLVAFWDGESKGTDHSIRLARKAGKSVEVIVVT